MFALGLAGTIYLVVSDLDLRWKILAYVLFVLGVTIGMVSSLDDTSRLILSSAVTIVGMEVDPDAIAEIQSALPDGMFYFQR